MNRENETIANAASLLIQRCLDALSGMDRKEKKKPDEEMCESSFTTHSYFLYTHQYLLHVENKLVLINLVFELKRMLTDPRCGATGRDHAIDLILKNLMHMDGGLPRGWSWQFVENDGLERLLKVSFLNVYCFNDLSIFI